MDPGDPSPYDRQTVRYSSSFKRSDPMGWLSNLFKGSSSKSGAVAAHRGRGVAHQRKSSTAKAARLLSLPFRQQRVAGKRKFPTRISAKNSRNRVQVSTRIWVYLSLVPTVLRGNELSSPLRGDVRTREWRASRRKRDVRPPRDSHVALTLRCSLPRIPKRRRVASTPISKGRIGICEC